jgi:RNA polymerase sigma-70 factor (ECF subfamily)
MNRMPAVPAPVRALPSSAAPSDRTLVERATSGDRWAEEAIYRRYVHRVGGVVARLLRHGPDVEDAMQDTFVEAFRDLSKLRDPDHLERWLVRIAVHQAHRRFRRRRLRRLLGLDRSLDDEPLALQAHSGASQEAVAELALLDRVLDRMNVRDRTAWVLRRLLDYPLAEVSQLCNCSLATAKRRVGRAGELVDAHLDELRREMP